MSAQESLLLIKTILVEQIERLGLFSAGGRQ
jgi:hypothetical protein